MKKITLIAICVAMIAAVSCGNNPKKKTADQEAVQEAAEVTESAPAARSQDRRAES